MTRNWNWTLLLHLFLGFHNVYMVVVLYNGIYNYKPTILDTSSFGKPILIKPCTNLREECVHVVPVLHPFWDIRDIWGCFFGSER